MEHPTHTRDVSPPAADSSRGTFTSAVALLAFIIAADLWLTHHFDVGFNNPAVFAGVIAAASGGLTFLKWVLDSREQEGIAESVRGVARFVLSANVLVPLYAAGAIAALTVSTVRVVADTPGAIDDVTLTPLDKPPGETRGSPDGLVRFTLVTTPFGRPVRVSVPGFVPTTFTVYPLGGLTLRLGQDVPVAPSVLFRPDKQALLTLRNDGTFRAWIVSGADSALIAETSAVATSYLLGRRVSIPGSLLEDWRLELACDTAFVRNFALLAWKRATVLHGRGPTPNPGDVVRAEVRAPSGKRVAATEVVLGSEPLIDILVPDDVPGAGGCR